MQGNILFDNIYIGHSVSDAEKLKKETFDVKLAAEKAEEAASKPKDDDRPRSPSDLKFTDDPLHYIREKVDLFMTIAKKDPVQAAKFVPEVAGGIGALVVLLLAVVAMGIGGGAAAAPSKEQIKDATKQAQAKATEAKDKVVDAASTGADKVQAEVNKRSTRSSGNAE